MEASSSIPPQKTEDMESQKQTRSTDQQPKLIMPLRWRWPDMTVNKIVPAPRFFELPEGWRFEMRPRTNEKYVGTVDKLYYEPGTGKIFRSLKTAREAAAKKQSEETNHTQETPNVVKLDHDEHAK